MSISVMHDDAKVVVDDDHDDYTDAMNETKMYILDSMWEKLIWSSENFPLW